MSRPASPIDSYTYADYVSWPVDERWELINGVAYTMSPAPSINHQEVVLALAVRLRMHFEGQPCRVLIAPVDVLLAHNDQHEEDTDTVVQPDVMVVCDQDKMTDKYVRGAPDLVIEVLSPSTAKKDEGLKRDVYETAGVREYWLIHPGDCTVNRYSLIDGNYGRPDVYGRGDELASTCFPDLALVLNEIFGIEEQAVRPSPGQEREA